MAHGEIRTLFVDALKINTDSATDLRKSTLTAAQIFADATDNLLTQERILIAKEDEVSGMEQLAYIEVCNEKDPTTGKQKYSNDTTRKTETEQRIRNDPTSKMHRDELYAIRMEVKECEKIREVARTTLKALEIISNL